MRKDVQFSSLTVHEAIDTLAKQFRVNVSYDANALPLDSVVSVTMKDAGVRDVLYKILSDGDVDVSYFMGQVVISRSHTEKQKSVEDFVRLSGKVVDSQKQEALLFVNISIVDGLIGTVTNDMGEFDFLIPRKYSGQSIAISSIGYRKQNVVVPEKDSSISVMMEPESIHLPEVQVKAVFPDRVLARVIEQRDENYLEDFVSLTEFYRETVKQDDQYIQISEAILEIYKPPYKRNSALERVRFVKGRKREPEKKSDGVNFKLQGGPFVFSRLDIARYLDFLPDNNRDNVYQYSYMGMSYLNGRQVYLIGFEPGVDTGDLLYKGVFSICSDDYAIVRVEFEMTRNTLKKSRDYLIKKDQRNNRAKPYYARYMVDYRPYKEKWILNHVRGELKIKVVDKRHRLKSDFVTKTEMVTTDLRPIDERRIKNSEMFKPDYVLYDEINADDSDFWEPYNIILPDEGLMNDNL